VGSEVISAWPVTERELPELLPLMRAYCDFYAVAPSDGALLALARALIADPEREGTQLIALDGGVRGVGFATLYWSWSTLGAARKGILNDLYVVPDLRGSGVAEMLIETARAHCARHGARTMSWQTAPDNHRAQALYARVGARREQWVDYSLPVGPTPADAEPL
jgi:GNAT superfamily N-acetyltransferase